MMTSLAPTYSPHPGGLPQHANIAQSHPMGQSSNHPGQAGPGISQQLHLGVSGPGTQVSPGQAMMTGIPPGAGGPSAHALQHLNPSQQQQAQAQMFQQQAMFASNPQLHQMQQHQHQQQQQIFAQQRHQHAAQRQAMIAQQYGNLPIGLQNGMQGMTPAQYQAIRNQAGTMRPMNIPQHLQAQQHQQQQQAELSLQQQQAQVQQQHLMMVQQQMAMRQQANPHSQNASSQGQPGQITPQQSKSIQQAQNALLQQQQHQQTVAAAAAAADAAASTPHQSHVQLQQQQQQQSQPSQQQQQKSSHPQAQQAPNSQVTTQSPAPQLTTSTSQHMTGMPPQITSAMLLQQQQHQRQLSERTKGQCLLKFLLFADHLSNFTSCTRPLEAYGNNPMTRSAAQGTKQRDDLNYWVTFVERFFSPRGVLRHSVWVMDEKSNKQYEITYPALPRYFLTHFESGIKEMQLTLEKAFEKELPNNNHYLESPKSSFVYWFESGSQLVASGALKVHFDPEQKIELLEFITSSHEEYLPRTQVVEAARPLHVWGKEWHKAKMTKSPSQPPPDIELPVSKVKASMGITQAVFRFLELAEVMIQMNPLFSYCHQNPNLSPPNALDQYVSNVASNMGPNAMLQQSYARPRTPAMGCFNMGASPAPNHLQLAGGSPRIGSPLQASGMQNQRSQHGTSSIGLSTSTSPNGSNKRGRPSMINGEDEAQINGISQKMTIKPSPRIGKRQKCNPV